MYMTNTFKIKNKTKFEAGGKCDVKEGFEGAKAPRF